MGTSAIPASVQSTLTPAAQRDRQRRAEQNTGSSQQPLQRFHLEPAPLFRGEPSGKVGEMGEVESVCHEGECVFP